MLLFSPTKSSNSIGYSKSFADGFKQLGGQVVSLVEYDERIMILRQI